MNGDNFTTFFNKTMLFVVLNRFNYGNLLLNCMSSAGAAAASAPVVLLLSKLVASLTEPERFQKRFEQIAVLVATRLFPLIEKITPTSATTASTLTQQQDTIFTLMLQIISQIVVQQSQQQQQSQSQLQNSNIGIAFTRLLQNSNFVNVYFSKNKGNVKDSSLVKLIIDGAEKLQVCVTIV